MAQTQLDLIQPGVLDVHLPQRPYGIEEWGFVRETAQADWVQVMDFDYPPSLYLRIPVVLAVRHSEPADAAADIEHAGVFLVENAQGEALCSVRWSRPSGDRWSATFHDQSQRQIGSAGGTVATRTAPQVIEGALVALLRHATVNYG